MGERKRGPMSADDTIRDLFRNHSKKDLIEVIVAQTQAAIDAEARPEQESHPFVESPYAPDRCRDCDHPASWHPNRPEQDEAVRLLDEARKHIESIERSYLGEPRSTVAGFNLLRQIDDFLEFAATPPPATSAALDERQRRIIAEEAHWSMGEVAANAFVERIVRRLAHQSEDQP